MRTLVLTCHSIPNEPLARLTALNKWNYSARHGYELMTMRMEWPAAKLGLLQRLQEMLPLYDQVLMVGSDVLFMNHRIRVEDVATVEDHLVLAREYLGDPKENWSTINNDVTIWRNTPASRRLVDHLIENEPRWRDQQLSWQCYMEKLIEEHPASASMVRLVEPSVMNASHLGGPEGKNRWKMGDWICHLVCGDSAEKFQRVMQFLPMADLG